MYEEQASPMPLPVGSFLNLSFQPEPRTTCSMQRPRPMVPTRSQLAVSELGGTRCLSRSSAGSSPSCSAILSRWTSSANRGCGVPWPRLGPHGGLFVETRAPPNRYAGGPHVTARGAAAEDVHG